MNNNQNNNVTPSNMSNEVNNQNISTPVMDNSVPSVSTPEATPVMDNGVPSVSTPEVTPVMDNSVPSVSAPEVTPVMDNSVPSVSAPEVTPVMNNSVPIVSVPEATLVTDNNMIGVPTYNNTPVNNVTPNNKKPFNKKLLIPIIIGGVILLGVIGFFIYTSLFVSSTSVYESAIDETFNGLMNNVLVIEENTTENTQNFNKFTMSGHFSYNTDSNFYSEYDGSKFTYDISLDSDKEKIIAELAIDNTTEATFALIKDKLYVDSSSLHHVPFYTTLTEEFDYDFIDNYGIDYGNVNLLLTKVSLYLKENIKEYEIISESKEIEVDGSKLNADAHILELDSTQLTSLYTSVLTDLKNDNEFVSAMTKNSSMSTDEYTANIDELIKAADFEGTELKFTIYTSGLLKEFAGYDIETNDELLLSYRQGKNEGTITIPSIEDLIIKVKENELSAEYKMDDTILTLNFSKVSNTEYNANGKLTMEDDYIEAKFNYINEVKTNSNYTKTDFNFDSSFGGEEINIGVSNENTIEFDKADKEFDTTNAVDMTTLTPTDMNNFSYKAEMLLTNTLVGEFFFDIWDIIAASISESTYDSSGYDYYDYNQDTYNYGI